MGRIRKWWWDLLYGPGMYEEVQELEAAIRETQRDIEDTWARIRALEKAIKMLGGK